MLCWNVYVGDFNNGTIEIYNIFNHYSFKEDCKKIAKKFAKDKDGFTEGIKHSLMYYFWSKCEWEIIIEQWPVSEKQNSRFKDEKVDVYDQVCLNWDIFIEYLWNNIKELKNDR